MSFPHNLSLPQNHCLYSSVSNYKRCKQAHNYKQTTTSGWQPKKYLNDKTASRRLPNSHLTLALHSLATVHDLFGLRQKAKTRKQKQKQKQRKKVTTQRVG